MKKFNTILITGGCGFIGSNLIRYLFDTVGFDGTIVNYDCLTYAGNLDNLKGIKERFGDRYKFYNGSISSISEVNNVFYNEHPDLVIHLAAESHVDRSINNPYSFITTNILGTYNLLETIRLSGKDVHFHHVSTDEVYGSLGDTGYFTEETPYDPRSPYSASKASSDHLVMAYRHTYGLSVTMSNCSNNYGPYQFPEKFIPLMILNMMNRKPLPVYGDGKFTRDWIYVDDHNRAILDIIIKGKSGDRYNVGGNSDIYNIHLLEKMMMIMAEETDTDVQEYKNLIVHVDNARPGHDKRYAIDCSKIGTELGWKPEVELDHGLRATIRWYLDKDWWLDRIKSGAYQTDHWL